MRAETKAYSLLIATMALIVASLAVVIISQLDGVNGTRETAYSSNVLYHYRTSEWTADEQGFYHDSEGRYVVAASDMEQGTVFQGSMGECIVLDSGCDAGVTDYYVNWR